MKILKIPSTPPERRRASKIQIPGPDRINAYSIYYRYRKLETDDDLHLPSRSRAGSNKYEHAAQAPALRVTEIQNSKQIE